MGWRGFIKQYINPFNLFLDFSCCCNYFWYEFKIKIHDLPSNYLDTLNRFHCLDCPCRKSFNVNEEWMSHSHMDLFHHIWVFIFHYQTQCLIILDCVSKCMYPSRGLYQSYSISISLNSTWIGDKQTLGFH